MLNDHIKNFKIIFLLFILLSTFSEANTVDISQNKEISLLENSAVYISDGNVTIQKILNENLFETYKKDIINIGASGKTIWIKIKLHNPAQNSVEKLLILTSSLLEHITLYEKEKLNTPIFKGVSHISKEHTTLFPYYNIHLDANASQVYYLKVRSLYEPVDFSLRLQDKHQFLAQDRKNQFVNIMLIGLVFGLMIYSFIVSFYLKDKSYRYYSFYLFFLVYQQLTYLGLTQIYFPPYLIVIDIAIPVLKINMLIITSTLFAMYFLKINQRPMLHKIYQFFILLAILEMIILSIPSLYNLNIVILTGALFIVFNLFAGIISYLQGYTQARLFIVGFSIVFASYVLMILDALGITSIMQGFQNILMFGTAFEALILSLAFADKYVILQREKEEVDKRILMEFGHRNAIVKQEVLKKTQELNAALEVKELLVKEVHHRVKNNLQMILSIIRLQNDEIEDKHVSQKFVDLESRINAISKTYNMLLAKDDLEEINMQEYINSLLADVHNIFDTLEQQICFRTNINGLIPLRESVYIGLIVNELVSNAYKYAFDGDIGFITISLHQDKNQCVLTVEDDGKGFVLDKKTKTLGLKLIHTLVYDQLGGEMEVHTNNHTKYTIRFSL